MLNRQRVPIAWWWPPPYLSTSGFLGKPPADCKGSKGAEMIGRSMSIQSFSSIEKESHCPKKTQTSPKYL